MYPRALDINKGNDKSNVPRPRTSPGHLTSGSCGPTSVHLALSNGDEPYVDEEEDEHFELLEYEWPDLPPLPSMKDAVSRRRVSQGISYLLPVDKGRNSINNRFRTDLRAMFQEPYASDDLQYDDSRVKLSAKIHFLSNTADTKWTHQHLSSVPTQLSADCEGARKLYVHSAPSGRMATRRMGLDPNKLRKRSNLFLPVKARKTQVSPEIVRLREEAATIIEQGLSYKDEEDDLSKQKNGKKGVYHSSLHLHPSTTGVDNAHDKPNHSVIQDASGCQLTTFGGSYFSNTLDLSTINAKLKKANIQQESFENYDDLRKSAAPRHLIPSEFQSRYLSSEENQRVWEWLHYGESMSEFDFFLSVCG